MPCGVTSSGGNSSRWKLAGMMLVRLALLTALLLLLGIAFQVLCSVGIKKNCSIVCGRCGTFSLCIRRFVVALKMKRCSFKLVRMCDRALVGRWKPRAELSGIGAEDGQPPATSWVRGGVPLRALACHVPS